MLEVDIPVWYRFLDSWGDLFVNLYYDCFLGGPAMSEADFEDSMKRMWHALTAKRPDVIAETEDEVWIIEVSLNPTLRALGQLMTYQTLWIEDQKIEKIERMAMVCDRVEPDIGAAAGKFGFQIYIV